MRTVNFTKTAKIMKTVKSPRIINFVIVFEPGHK